MGNFSEQDWGTSLARRQRCPLRPIALLLPTPCRQPGDGLGVLAWAAQAQGPA